MEEKGGEIRKQNVGRDMERNTTGGGREFRPSGLHIKIKPMR